MSLSRIGKIRLRNALVAMVAMFGMLAAVTAPAAGVDDDWPEGAIVEAPGEFQLPPPEPDPDPSPGPTPEPTPSAGDDEGIAVYMVVTMQVWEIPAPPDPSPSPSGTATTATGDKAPAVQQQVRCNTARASTSALNIFRATLWTYEMEVDWCWNGARVTSTAGPRISGNVTGWAAALGWNYEGVRNMNGPADRFGNNWVYRTYSQGAFAYSPPPRLWTIQRVYPRLWIDVFGNGASRTWGA